MLGKAEMEVKYPDPESHLLYQQVLRRHHGLYAALEKMKF